MQTLIIREFLSYCDKNTVLYLAALVVLVWAAIKLYQYLHAENLRAKRQRKMMQLITVLCDSKQAAWLYNDAVNSKPPED